MTRGPIQSRIDSVSETRSGPVVTVRRRRQYAVTGSISLDVNRVAVLTAS